MAAQARQEHKDQPFEINGPIKDLCCQTPVYIAHPDKPGGHREVMALVDTGATVSGIKMELAIELMLPKTGRIKVETADGSCDVDVVTAVLSMKVRGRTLTTRTLPLGVCRMVPDMLFGMDLVAAGILKINGPNGSWTWNVRL